MTRNEEKNWQEDSWDGPDAWGSSEFEEVRQEKRPDSRTVFMALTVVMSLVVALGIGGLWYLRQLNPPDSNSGIAQVATNFTVNPNDSLAMVVSVLKMKDSLSTQVCFVGMCRVVAE